MNQIPDWLSSLVVSENRPEAVPISSADLAYNMPAMFIAYTRGASLGEIAQLFGVPDDTLEAVARDQQWGELSARLKLEPVESDSAVAARLEKMEANREANYNLADDLRQDLARKFAALANGTLKIENIVKHKEGYDVAETNPAPRDIKALAEAARIMSELTYRALGDNEEPKKDKGKVAETSAVQINVNIPSAIANMVDTGPIIES